MKPKLLIVAVAAGLAASVSSCGGPGTDTMPEAVTPASSVTPASQMTPASPVIMEVTTAQILREAQQPSESAEPYPVNNGVLVFTDTSDTTEPIAIDAAM